MKRQRDHEEQGIFQSIDLANCLMLLSHPTEITKSKPHKQRFGPVEFECVTCNRKFSSFQALGGHRASHKKSKREIEELKSSEAVKTDLRLGINNKHKMHECSVCGQEFALGQALGGHMRRHRVATTNEFAIVPAVLKRSNSCKRVMFLDLNLTPLQNDMKLLFGNNAPKLDYSFVN